MVFAVAIDLDLPGDARQHNCFSAGDDCAETMGHEVPLFLSRCFRRFEVGVGIGRNDYFAIFTAHHQSHRKLIYHR